LSRTMTQIRTFSVDTHSKRTLCFIDELRFN
jgi:hypothetical protein